MINLVDDTNDKVVVIKKSYLSTVPRISSASTISSSSSISSTSSKSTIDSPLLFYNINMIS